MSTEMSNHSHSHAHGNATKLVLATVVVGFLASSLAIGSGAAYAAGTITGTVKYEGRVPNPQPLKMDADPVCAAKHSTPVKPELMVVGPGNGFANIFVRVKSGLPAGKTYPAPASPVVMDQNGCIYKPHVMGIQVGQKFKILNSDGVLHNVHSLSKTNAPFNRAMPGNVKEAEFSFTKTESFKVKCDVHPWMGAFVHVLDNPFYAVTGADGKFSIKGLPPGTYEIEAWHEFEKFPPQTVKVTIAGDETKPADFTFKGPSS